MTVNALCVFCGSAEGTRPADVAAARTLGTALAQRGIAVVYGGARTGLMGAVADAALAARGPVIGVIPRMLVERERAHPGLTQLHVVDSMAERKARMAELCDGFLALPGGIGTLEELVEVLSWARLGLHTKPCGILDLDGFYAPLFDFLDGARAAGFITAADDVVPARATTVEELLPAVLGRLGDDFAGPAPR